MPAGMEDKYKKGALIAAKAGKKKGHLKAKAKGRNSGMKY